MALPGVPGSLLVWAAVLWWATAEATGPAWAMLAGATGVLLLAQAVTWLLPARRTAATGVTRSAFLLAVAVAVVGFFVLPLVGAPLGLLATLYATERRRLGGHAAAWASTRTVLRAAGASVLVELFACLLVTGGWLTAVVTA
ncbi:DUF456 domain-containing protein [Streptomyces sp. M19]